MARRARGLDRENVFRRSRAEQSKEEIKRKIWSFTIAIGSDRTQGLGMSSIDPYLSRGFEPIRMECDSAHLRTEGEVPKELDGTF